VEGELQDRAARDTLKHFLQVTSDTVFLKRIPSYLAMSQEEKPMKYQDMMFKKPECGLADAKICTIAQRMQSEVRQ